ncbi:MAG TPA: hypothetical protein DCQ24_03425 [Bacteroidales bacterium]|nr:hypothetical protein [Bacteroidales bacterium]
METTEPLSLIIITSIHIVYNAINVISTIDILLSLIALFFSALVSGAETAYFSIKSSTLNEIQNKSDFKNKLFISQLQDAKKLLSTLTITKFIFSISFIILQAVLLNQIFNFTENPALGFIIQLTFIGLVYLLFVEYAPRFFAHKYPERFAQFVSIPIAVFEKIFYPFIILLAKNSSIITNKLIKTKHNITIDDLSHALNLSSQQIAEDEDIIKGIMKFGNIDAGEIMRSRVDVVAVDYDLKFKELLQLIIESGHSRYPVYSESFDNVKGILYNKDLLEHFDKDDDFNWQSLIRPPYFIPEYKKINELLKEFQSNKIHMAIVIDEYGGTNGIVTLEDVLEEIVGEITDESDEEELSYSKLDENTYLFEGKTLVNDFNKILNIEDDFFDDINGDADTIAGIILDITGEIPEKNKIIKYKNLTFTIEAVDKRRIKQIKVTINQ